MISKLTGDQVAKIIEYRDKYWKRMIDTSPVDAQRAEKVAKKLVQAGGVTMADVGWVSSFERGNEIYKREWNSIEELCGDLCEPISGELFIDSFRGSISDLMVTALTDLFTNSVRHSTVTSIRKLFNKALWTSWKHSVENSFAKCSEAFLKKSVRKFVWDLLMDSFKVGDDIKCYWGASFWGSYSLLAYYKYLVEVLGMPCSDNQHRMLHCCDELSANCFAMWVLPKKIILCVRPSVVEVQDGRIVSVEWPK